MRIAEIKSAATKPITIQDIDFGNVFRHSNILWQKVCRYNTSVNAVQLSNGVGGWFNNLTQVIPVDGEFVPEN